MEKEEPVGAALPSSSSITATTDATTTTTTSSTTSTTAATAAAAKKAAAVQSIHPPLCPFLHLANDQLLIIFSFLTERSASDIMKDKEENNKAKIARGIEAVTTQKHTLSRICRHFSEVVGQTISFCHVYQPPMFAEDDSDDGYDEEEEERKEERVVEEGAEALIRRRPALQELILSRVCFSSSFGRVVQQGLCQNLRRLSLSAEIHLSAAEPMWEMMQTIMVNEISKEEFMARYYGMLEGPMSAFATALQQNALPMLERLEISVSDEYKDSEGRYFLPILQALSGGASPLLREIYLEPFADKEGKNLSDFCSMLRARQAAGCKKLVQFPTVEFVARGSHWPAETKENFDFLLQYFLPEMERLGVDGPFCYERLWVKSRFAEQVGKWLIDEANHEYVPRRLRELVMGRHIAAQEEEEARDRRRQDHYYQFGEEEEEEDETYHCPYCSDLYDNGVRDLLQAIAAKKLPALEVLRMRFFSYEYTEIIPALCAAIEGTPGLRCLDFSWTKEMDEDEMKMVFLALSREGLTTFAGNGLSVTGTVEEVYLPRFFACARGDTPIRWYEMVVNFLKGGGIASLRRLHLGQLKEGLSIVTTLVQAVRAGGMKEQGLKLGFFCDRDYRFPKRYEREVELKALVKVTRKWDDINKKMEVYFKVLS